MTLQVLRQPACDGAIVGLLSVDGVFQSYTLESVETAIRSTRRGQSRPPAYERATDMTNPLTLLAKPFTALAGKVDRSVEQKILMSIVRHVVSLAGGALVTHGVLAATQSGQFEQIAGGAILGLIALFSGGAQKVQEGS